MNARAVRFVGSLLPWVSSVWAPLAHAADDATFSLEYAAPAECPTRAEFITALTSRVPSAREAVGESPRVELAVMISGADMAYGSLRLRLRDGQESLREVPSAPCSEVTASMAVIAAMVIEGAGLDVAGSAGSQAPPPRSRVVIDRDARLVAVTERRPIEARGAGWMAHPGLVLAANVESAVAPSPGWGVAAGLDLELERFDGRREHSDDAERLPGFSPSLRVLGRMVRTSTERLRGYGDAHFRLLAATVTACPMQWSLSRVLAVRPCAVVDAGDLEAEGKNTRLGRVHNMLWLGFGAAPRIQLRLSGWAALEVEARALVLTYQDDFVFEPDRVAHSVPPVAFALSINTLAQFL